MGTSFTEYRGYGFWANDGLLSVWLAALADAVPDDALPWLREAEQHWREQAGTGFTGCVDAALDTLLARNVRLDYAQQIRDAFVALLRGVLATTAKTSPVLPRLGEQPGNPESRTPA